MFGYIGKHWRGEFDLPQSYWINGVLLLMPFNIYLRVATAVFEAQPPHSSSTLIYAYILPFTCLFVLVIWAGVGIWRSAGQRIRDGRPGWAWVARIVIMFNLVILIFSVFSILQLGYALEETWRFEQDTEWRAERHGDYVVFRGPITHASSAALQPLLKKAEVKRLVIEGSNGGFIVEATMLAKIIHERGLFVVAVGQCDSACTVLLAAGGTRAVTPATQTGFHRATVPGYDMATKEDEAADRYLTDAGIGPVLLAKMRSHHGAGDAYDPPLRELIESGFLTDIFVEEKHGYQPAMEWCQENPKPCDRSGLQNAHRTRTPGGAKNDQ